MCQIRRFSFFDDHVMIDLFSIRSLQIFYWTILLIITFLKVADGDKNWKLGSLKTSVGQNHHQNRVVVVEVKICALSFARPSSDVLLRLSRAHLKPLGRGNHIED